MKALRLASGDAPAPAKANKSDDAGQSGVIVPVRAFTQSVVERRTDYPDSPFVFTLDAPSGAPPAVPVVPVVPTEEVVLTLSEVGEILSATGNCTNVFHCAASILTGQNICMLLHGGLDNEIGRALYGHRLGKPPPERTPIRLTALRKTGTQFCAAFVTLDWKEETDATAGADGTKSSHLRWTLEVREVKTEVPAAAPVSPAPVTAGEGGEKPALELSASDAIWREKLEEAKLLQSRAEAARDEARAEALRMSDELTAARQEAEEMRTQARTEKLASAEHKVRADRLGELLQQATGETELIKTQIELAQEWGTDEAELRGRLESAKEAVDLAEAALKEEVARREKAEERLQTLSRNLKAEQAERSKRFDQELISLRQERDELNSRLNQEQNATGDSQGRIEELSSRLARNAVDFQNAMAELEKQTAERERSETQWKEQLDTAWIAKKEIEGQFASAVERNKHFEAELASLRKERDELISKLTSEQQVVAESSQRAHELESRLGRNASESERARLELEKHTSERGDVEAEWRRELEEARVRKEDLEKTLSEAHVRARALEEERAKLHRDRDQLARQVEEFKARQAASERAASEAQSRFQRLEEERAALQKRGDELSARLASEQKAAVEFGRRVEESRTHRGRESAQVEQRRAELDREMAERDSTLTKTLEQLEAVRVEKKDVESAWTTAVDRNVQLEEEVTVLRRERDELNAKAKTEQQAALEARRRAEESDSRCTRLTAELERSKGAKDKKHSERDRYESEWTEQLNAAKALTRKLETAWNGAVERSRTLEEELRSIRQEHDRVQSNLAAEQQVAVALRERVRALESRLKEKSPEAATSPSRNPSETPANSALAAPGASVAPRTTNPSPAPRLPGKNLSMPGTDHYNLKP